MRTASVFTPAEDEPGVERPRHGAERLLQEAEALRDRRVVRAGEAADDVRVAAEVLRRRVEDDVGAEIERALEVRGRERVVDDQQGAGRLRGAATARDVDEVEQRVRRRLDPDEPRVADERARVRRELGGCRVREAVALRLVHLREHPVRAAVDVVDADDAVAGVEQVHDRRRRADPGGERVAVRGVLERREALLERRAGRVRAARVVVALVDADRLLRERRGLVDRRRHRAGRRVGLLAGVDGARLEVHRGIVAPLSRSAGPAPRVAAGGAGAPPTRPRASGRARRSPRGSSRRRRRGHPARPRRRAHGGRRARRSKTGRAGRRARSRGGSAARSSRTRACRRHVHLQPVVEAEERRRAVAVVDERGRRARGATVRGTPGARSSSSRCAHHSPSQPVDLRRGTATLAHERAERRVRAGWVAVELPTELAAPCDALAAKPALDDGAGDLGRSPPRLPSREAPLGEVPDALVALAADDRDLAAEPEDVEHPPERLAVVPAARAPLHDGAVLEVAREQRATPPELAQHVAPERRVRREPLADVARSRVRSPLG